VFLSLYVGLFDELFKPRDDNSPLYSLVLSGGVVCRGSLLVSISALRLLSELNFLSDLI
jgi:hypothetical protein